MKLVKVCWTEYHEQEVWVDSEDEAYDLVDIDVSRGTFKESTLVGQEILQEEKSQEDDMDRAHAKSEEALFDGDEL